MLKMRAEFLFILLGYVVSGAHKNDVSIQIWDSEDRETELFCLDFNAANITHLRFGDSSGTVQKGCSCTIMPLTSNATIRFNEYEYTLSDKGSIGFGVFQTGHLTVMENLHNISLPVDIDLACRSKMEYIETLPLNALTGSSSLGVEHSYSRSKLNTESGQRSGGWKPRVDRIGEYIQADLGLVRRLLKCAIQGRQRYNEWVMSYQFAYSLTGENYSYILTETGKNKNITGNNDRNTIVYFIFAAPIYARYVRIYPQKWHKKLGLRWGVCGCELPCRLEIEYISTLPDQAFSGSSEFNNRHTFSRSRLNSTNGFYGGAWTAAQNSVDQYIQADLGTVGQLVAIATQGREDTDEWVTTYMVAHSMTESNFTYILNTNKSKTIFGGNTDRNSVVANAIHPRELTRYVRIYPQSWHSRISLRWGVFGCNVDDTLFDLECTTEHYDSTQGKGSKQNISRNLILIIASSGGGILLIIIILITIITYTRSRKNNANSVESKVQYQPNTKAPSDQERGTIEDNTILSDNEPIVYAEINQASLSPRDHSDNAVETVEYENKMVQNDIHLNYADLAFENADTAEGKNHVSMCIETNQHSNNEESSPYENFGKIEQSSKGTMLASSSEQNLDRRGNEYVNVSRQ